MHRVVVLFSKIVDVWCARVWDITSDRGGSQRNNASAQRRTLLAVIHCIRFVNNCPEQYFLSAHLIASCCCLIFSVIMAVWCAEGSFKRWAGGPRQCYEFAQRRAQLAVTHRIRIVNSDPS